MTRICKPRCGVRAALLLLALGSALPVAMMPPAQAAESAATVQVAGVAVPASVPVGDQELVLNGAGVRKKVVFKVYVAALYLPMRASGAATAIDGAGPRRITLYLLRDLDADTLVGALREGLAANLAAAQMAALAPQVEQLSAVMRGIGKTRSGDVVGLDFTAAGVAVSFNRQARGQVAGEAFGRALLRVWLGDKPVDADLKQALLGG